MGASQETHWYASYESIRFWSTKREPERDTTHDSTPTIRQSFHINRPAFENEAFVDDLFGSSD
jgi:hypothetical protein